MLLKTYMMHSNIFDWTLGKLYHLNELQWFCRCLVKNGNIKHLWKNTPSKSDQNMFDVPVVKLPNKNIHYMFRGFLLETSSSIADGPWILFNNCKWFGKGEPVSALPCLCKTWLKRFPLIVSEVCFQTRSNIPQLSITLNMWRDPVIFPLRSVNLSGAEICHNRIPMTMASTRGASPCSWGCLGIAAEITYYARQCAILQERMVPSVELARRSTNRKLIGSWLIDWLTKRQTDWLVDSQTLRLIHRLAHKLMQAQDQSFSARRQTSFKSAS